MVIMIFLYTVFRDYGMRSHGRGSNNNLKKIAMASKENETLEQPEHGGQDDTLLDSYSLKLPVQLTKSCHCCFV